MSRKDRQNNSLENGTRQVAGLRQRAEAAFSARAGLAAENFAPLSPEAMRQTLHNLRVHQIELERRCASRRWRWKRRRRAIPTSLTGRRSAIARSARPG